MKRHNFLSTFLTLTLVFPGLAELKGQTESTNTPEISYTVARQYSTTAADTVSVEVKIAKSQFNSPLLVGVSLKDSLNVLVFEKVAEIALISGASLDSTRHFEVNAQNFIFRLKNIPAKRYKLSVQAIQEDTNGFFIEQEEDWRPVLKRDIR